MISKMAARSQGGLSSLPVLAASSIEAYANSVCMIPVLDARTEAELAARVHDHHDLEAARTLILSNLRFVVYMARRYLGYGLPHADLIQQGNIGLMQAVSRFDPGVGVRLISYASHYILSEIHKFVLCNWHIVKMATTKAQQKLFFGLRRLKQHDGWLSESEATQIASDLGVSVKEVLSMEARLANRDISFDAPPRESNINPFEMPADCDTEAEVENEQWESTRRMALPRAIANLDHRSRDILKRRLLCEGKPAGLQELANEYGVSAERIRQIQNKALSDLRLSLESECG